MSFYNMIHGFNPLAPMVLAMVGVSQERVPRFRDAYWNGEHLCVHTRTGGGNRDYYESEESCRSNYPEYFGGKDDPDGPWNEDLRALPGFVRDEDDDYDSTYATFYFDVPERFGWFREWANDKTAKPPAERWQAAIDHIKSAPMDDPMVQKITAVLAPVVEFLQKPSAPPE